MLNVSNDSVDYLSVWQRGVFGALFGTLSLLGMGGNLLVIIAIVSDKKMRSVMNLLLLSLACADLGNLSLCTPDWLQMIIGGGPSWLLPDPLCPLIRYVPVAFLFASVLTQVAVSVERFIAINMPMKARLYCTRRKVAVVTASIWVFTFVFAAPYGFYHQIDEEDGRKHCRLHLPARYALPYKAAECLLFYFAPLVVIAVLYTKIGAVLWSRDPHLHEGAQRHAESLKTRQNVVKMLIACVALYFVSYSPIQAIFLSSALFGRAFQIRYAIRVILNAFAYSSSALNPVMYTCFSKQFRQKFAALLLCSENLSSGQAAKGATTRGSPLMNSSPRPECTYLLQAKPVRNNGGDGDLFPQRRATTTTEAVINDQQTAKLSPTSCAKTASANSLSPG